MHHRATFRQPTSFDLRFRGTRSEQLLCCLVLLLAGSPSSLFAAPPDAQIISVRKIWDRAPHNAFTDLVRWSDRFVCAFREGRGHVSTDGRIRVLTSPDGEAWKSDAVLKLDGYDLRDASLSVTPDGRLMLLGGASPRSADGANAPTGSFVSFSDDAINWSTPTIVLEPGRWLWRVTWHRGKCYGVSYAAGTPDKFASLLVSNDGLEFTTLVHRLFDKGYPTEAVVRFVDDSTMYCLLRRDGKAPHNSAMFGTSSPDYSEWQWNDLGLYFGGPNFIRLPNEQWIAAGRVMGDGGPKTKLAWLDVENKILSPVLELPSGGDTSYPGLVWHDGSLWVSYYSSHEGKTSIYLAEVAID